MQIRDLNASSYLAEMIGLAILKRRRLIPVLFGVQVAVIWWGSILPMDSCMMHNIEFKALCVTYLVARFEESHIWQKHPTQSFQVPSLTIQHLPRRMLG